MSLKSVKRKVGIILNKSVFRPVLEKANLLLFHWTDRMHIEHHGIQDKTILVIRPQTNTQGLLSSYLFVLKYVRWAESKNIEAVVDFASENCQYYTGRKIDGSCNAWDYYFEQPSTLVLSDISNAKNVLYSGWSFFLKNQPIAIPETVEAGENEEIIGIAHQKCGIKPYIYEIVNAKYKELFNGIVLGVFLRGTDYVRLHPKGHPVQPSIEQAIEKIDEFLCKHNDINQIFVVTEDYTYYQKLRDKYGDMIFCSDDSFVEDYKDSYVFEAFKDDPYDRGLNYLVRILLFGRCDYVIAGITNGSITANILKEKKPCESFWFELGNY